MAAKVRDLIRVLKQFPPDMELVGGKMFAITEGGTDAYDLGLKIRLVGVAQYKNEGLVLLVGYTEDLSKIATIKKLEKEEVS